MYETVTLGNAARDKETIYPKYSEVEAGTVLAEGLYTGSYEGTSQFGPFLNFYVDCGANVVGLKKAGNLGALIEKANLIANTSEIRIIYLGKQVMQGGNFAGREAHTFQLDVKKAVQ